jgi:hypothetical protein
MYVSLTAAALLIGAAAFTSVFHNEAKAQGLVTSSAIHCFVGSKMDRPDQHIARGWVCIADQVPVVTH